MKVLNILTGGNTGGIESLCKDIGLNSKYENAFCFMSFGGDVCDLMNKNGLHTYNLSTIGHKVSLKKFKKLYEIAKDYDIIAVHHDDPILKLYHWLLSKFLKKKYVTFVHSCLDKDYFYPDNKIKRAVAHRIFQMGLNISDVLIFVSGAGKKSYSESFKFSDDKAYIVYNGVGVDKIEEGSKAVLEPKAPYTLTYVGRLVPEKGVSNLLTAVGELRSKYDIRLNIVGEGVLRKELEDKAKTLKIDDITTFYGQRLDVNNFLTKTDIFVYPTVCQEIFGISIVEAMAFGRIVVASAVGGIPEIIDNNVNGLMFDKNKQNELTETISKALDMIINKEYSEMSQKAKQRAQKFTIMNTVHNIEDIYTKLN